MLSKRNTSYFFFVFLTDPCAPPEEGPEVKAFLDEVNVPPLSDKRRALFQEGITTLKDMHRTLESEYKNMGFGNALYLKIREKLNLLFDPEGLI